MKAAARIYHENKEEYKAKFMEESSTAEFHKKNRQQTFDDYTKQLKNIAVSFRKLIISEGKIWGYMQNFTVCL